MLTHSPCNGCHETGPVTRKNLFPFFKTETVQKYEKKGS